MITFHGDSLVPAELCRLLYLTVPEQLHVPVAFHNRPTPLVSRGALATCHGDQIHVNLNKVYNSALWERTPGALTVRVWRTLLGICYIVMRCPVSRVVCAPPFPAPTGREGVSWRSRYGCHLRHLAFHIHAFEDAGRVLTAAYL